MLKAPPPRPPQGVRQSVSHSPRHCERRKACGNPSPLWGITDSFVLRTQNDKPFSQSESRVNGCGNPFPTPTSLRGSNATVAIRFPFKGEADSFVLCTQNDKPFSCHEYRVVCAVSCRPVIANAVRRVTIRFFSFGVLRILSRFAFRMTNRLVKVNYVRARRSVFLLISAVAVRSA